MLIGRAICWLLAVNSPLHWNVWRFWPFLRNFHLLGNHGNPKCSPRKVRLKRRALKRAVLNHPDQLATHILETTATGEVVYLRVTRTCNRGISFRNRSDRWSHWPSQCWRLWSRCLLAWIWISGNLFIIESVSNGWVRSQKFGSFSAFASVNKTD